MKFRQLLSVNKENLTDVMSRVSLFFSAKFGRSFVCVCAVELF